MRKKCVALFSGRPSYIMKRRHPKLWNYTFDFRINVTLLEAGMTYFKVTFLRSRGLTEARQPSDM
jgi:hypothetical protein